MSVSLSKAIAGTTTVTLYGKGDRETVTQRVRDLARASFAGIASTDRQAITNVAYDGTARSVWTVTAYA